MTTVNSLQQDRLQRAKVAYTLRNVNLELAENLYTDKAYAPRPGDMVLARVDAIGQHGGVELRSGRRSTLYVGDEVVVCYGNRYAPDQFEAEVPEDMGSCHLVAAGGMAGRVLSSYSSMKEPTAITPIGLLADSDGKVMNLEDWKLPHIGFIGARPLTVAVLGTTMNSGKTTSLTNFIRGLVSSGKKVGAAKVTGTGAGKDGWLMSDAGATLTYDFTDAGYVSTYKLSHDKVEEIFAILTGHLAHAGVDIIVLEIADGILQSETAALLSSAIFKSSVDHVLFATRDSAGAVGGVDLIRRQGINIIAVSGVLTNSPLAASEAAKFTGLPVIHTSQLCDPDTCVALLDDARKTDQAIAV